MDLIISLLIFVQLLNVTDTKMRGAWQEVARICTKIRQNLVRITEIILFKTVLQSAHQNKSTWNMHWYIPLLHF